MCPLLSYHFTLLLILLLLLVGITSGYVAGTYAKYTSEITPTAGTATVAKWNFDVENNGKAVTVDADLTKTYDANTLVSGKIAPGTEGAFKIELANETSEVGVNYEITIGDITGKPTNLKFYKDAAHTQEISAVNKVTGTLNVGAIATKVDIYWAWEYETDAIATNDPIDTTDGKAAASLTIPVTIVGTQVRPVETTP
ncbi:MAG: hypothetical protein IJ743_01400 [Bacilli bacterium]|nr:hypothetical protein [Bacilli bacterium]